MDFKLNISQKLSQSLRISPQLKHAIYLLQLSRQDLTREVEKQLLENPLLEEDRETSKNNEEIVDTNANTDEESFLLNDYDQPSISKSSSSNDMPSYEAIVSNPKTLKDYVLEQIRLTDLTEINKSLVEYLIGDLDSSGYLRLPASEICKKLNINEKECIEGIEFIQTLEPAGIGARTLEECLLLQLERLGLRQSIEGRLISQHSKLLESRDFQKIAKLENIEIGKVIEALKVIQKLTPNPCSEYSNNETQYIVPDVYVYKHEDEFVISLNEEGLPKLRLSSYYVDILEGQKSKNGVDKKYLSERLKSASWIIKSIYQRQKTLFKVSESILKFQKDFFELGVKHLKPLSLKDVATDIQMHESTVSRITSNKFMDTPRGIFELKFFFTNSFSSGNGDEVSSNSVKEKIKDIVISEDKLNPISDQAIVDTLKAEGITIARRTVSKYRKELGISTAAKRKKNFSLSKL